MLILIVVIFLPVVKTIALSNLSLLNSGNILFQKEQCMLFLFAMTAEDTKNIHLSSEYGTYSINDANIRKPSFMGFPDFSCLIGITYYDQVLPIQDLLIWCRTKQTILLDQNKNKSSNLQINSLEGRIDKRHHPILVLRQLANNENVGQVVICRGAKRQRTINHFTMNKWVVENKSYSMGLERQCNNENHMFYGKDMVASAFGVAPFVVFNSNITEVTGIAVDLALVLADRLQFNLSFLPSNLSFEVDLQTLEVKGSAADVLYGRADFELQGPLRPINDNTYEYVHHPLHRNNSGMHDYTFPHYQSNLFFVTYYPGKKRPIYNLIRVFDFATWLFAIGSLVATTLVYSFVCRFKKGELVRDTVWVPYGILFQEFHDYNPKVTNTSTNLWKDLYNLDLLLKLLWTLTSFLLVIAFGSELRSQLAIQEYEETLDSLDELLNDGRPIFISQDTQLIIFLQSLGGDLGLRISNHAMAGGNIIETRLDGNDVMLRKALTERGAALTTPEFILFDQARYMVQGQEYPMYIIPEIFSVQHIGFTFSRYSPMTKPVNDVMMKILDSGIINHIFDMRSPYRRMKNQRPRTLSDNKLALLHLAIPLVFCFAGWLLATLCFMQESRAMFVAEYKYMTCLGARICSSFKQQIQNVFMGESIMGRWFTRMRQYI